MLNDVRRPLLPKRDPALDWMRGVLVLFVLVLHAEITSEIGRNSVLGYLNMSIGPILMPTFFILSGILGQSALNRAWNDFLNRTFLRLVWPYLIWGFVYVFVVSLVEQKFELNGNAFAFLLTRPTMLGPVWYLAYLAAFFLVARCLRPVSPWAVLVILAGATMILSYFNLPFVDASIHASAFFAGLALARRSTTWECFSESAVVRTALPLTICALSASPFFFSDGLRDNGLLITWILFASVIVVAGARRLYGLFGSPFITKMGIWSLVFYLTHWPVMLVVRRVNSELHLDNPIIAFWVGLFLSLGVGALVVKLMRKNSLVLGLFEAPRLAWFKGGDSVAASHFGRSRLGK